VQQRLPDVLSAVLEEAVYTWDSRGSAEARDHLIKGVRPAEEKGYL
jgi:hypothetical protein